MPVFSEKEKSFAAACGICSAKHRIQRVNLRFSWVKWAGLSPGLNSAQSEAGTAAHALGQDAGLDPLTIDRPGSRMTQTPEQSHLPKVFRKCVPWTMNGTERL